MHDSLVAALQVAAAEFADARPLQGRLLVQHHLVAVCTLRHRHLLVLQRLLVLPGAVLLPRLIQLLFLQEHGRR